MDRDESITTNDRKTEYRDLLDRIENLSKFAGKTAKPMFVM